MKTIIPILMFGLLLSHINIVQAQLKVPAASPSAKISQNIGLMEASVEYARPAMRGRAIFGDLIPYGEIWRTGANASTKITFSDAVKLNDNEIPAGTYALYSMPNKEEWTIIIHKNIGHWGDGGNDYNPSEDLVRFKVPVKQLDAAVENFTIGFSDLTTNSGKLQLSWEKTMVEVDLVTEVDEKVMAQIDQLMSPKRDVGLYYTAASYYYSEGKDMQQASEWINKAVELDERFYIVHLQAKIYAAMDNKKAAEKSAKRSIEMAKEAGNDDYVRLNEKLLNDLNGKR